MKTSREVLLNGENISCLAAREILGLTGCEESHVDECHKELVREGRFMSKEAALRALMGIPRMERKPRNILLSSRTISPDVYVFYLSPKHFMMMTQAYQRATGEELRLDVSSVMPVCGNCTVRPYVTDRICASFGCAESRTYGMITDDKFVVGMPVGNAASVTRSLMEMMNRS